MSEISIYLVGLPAVPKKLQEEGVHHRELASTQKESVLADSDAKTFFSSLHQEFEQQNGQLDIRDLSFQIF